MTLGTGYHLRLNSHVKRCKTLQIETSGDPDRPPKNRLDSFLRYLLSINDAILTRKRLSSRVKSVPTTPVPGMNCELV